MGVTQNANNAWYLDEIMNHMSMVEREIEFSMQAGRILTAKEHSTL